MANAIDAVLKFHTDALNVRAYRQQLLAANIANADTPGYKARDIDFRRTMQDKMAGGATANAASVSLVRTSAAHLAPRNDVMAAPGPVLYRNPVQPSLDGNTVDMDVERAQFAQNAIHYEANLMMINSQLKALLSAIQG
jgi:flagellar basal-body rod protein FlgB